MTNPNKSADEGKGMEKCVFRNYRSEKISLWTKFCLFFKPIKWGVDFCGVKVTAIGCKVLNGKIYVVKELEG